MPSREQVQAQATTGGDRGVLRSQFAHQRAHVELADHRVQATGIQPRHIQQAIEQLFGRAQRCIHALGQVLLLIAHVIAVAQRGSEQACGVQWLQHVMADRRQEAGLRLLRDLGLMRTLGHALFQRLVGFQQGLFRVLVVGDVVVAGHVTAAGQRLPAHLDHLAIAAGALEHVR